MNNLQYSIVSVVIGPRMNDKINIGLILFDGTKAYYRYSNKRLTALKSFYSEKEYLFNCRVIRSLAKDSQLDSEEKINYLSRYSNNMITISALKPSLYPDIEKSSKVLYSSYIGK